MSWFQSLRDDFTLRPFENPQTLSDGAAMASGPPDSINQEPAEVQEECSGKKKSKFQTFKKFFTRKKRKEPSPAGAEAGLKASQSSDDVSKTSENNTLTRSEKEKGSGSKISLGTKAMSHDSVFVSDSSEANEGLGASQDSIHGKVKSLQLQLKQAMKLGSPPSLMCVKKTEDAGTMSEDDGLPCSPPECSTPLTVMVKASHTSSRAVSPLVVPGDFSQPVSPFSCLDNSAAKHKLGLRQKACNKRKPATRLEWKTEDDSAVEEMLTVSVPGAEAEALEEQKQQTEDASSDQVKPELEREEEEDEECEKRGHPLDSTVSLLRDKEREEEGEDEAEAEQDVSHGPDTSCPLEPSLSEEEGSDDQPLPSSISSSRASSVDASRATPEPPAGLREGLSGPPGDNHAESDSASVEEDEVQEDKEEECSLLQEVLSSLKTPLESCSLDVETEDVVLEMKEDKRGKEEEQVEMEESVAIKEGPGVEKSEEIQSTSPLLKADAAVVSGEDNVHKTKETNDEVPAEVRDQVFTTVQEGLKNLYQNFEDEREDGEEEALEDDLTEEMSEEEEKQEEVEADQPHVEKTEHDLEDGSAEITPHLDMPQIKKGPREAAEQVTVSSKPPQLCLSDSLSFPSQESAVSPSSKTTIMHINLASPTSEGNTALFQPSPTSVDPSKSVIESPPSGGDSPISTQQNEASVDEEQAEDVEEKQPTQEQEDSSAGVEEAVAQSPDQSKVRFTIAPAWQRSQNSTSPSSPPACIFSSKEDEEAAATTRDQVVKEEPAGSTAAEVMSSPGRVMNAENTTSKPQSNATPAPDKPPSSVPAGTVGASNLVTEAESAVIVEGNPDNPFGVRLRKTSALLRFSSEEESHEPSVESLAQPGSSKVDTTQPMSSKPPVCQSVGSKPALPKKPEVQGDAGGKAKRVSEAAGGRGVSAGSDPPSWISVAKQRQKIYKENSLEEINVKKEEQDRKSSLPTYVSSAASWEHSNKTVESSSNVGQMDISKPSVSVEKEPKRTLPSPSPVPPQPSKSQPLPCPIAPKRQVPSATSKPSPQPNPPQRSLSAPTPVPVPSKSLPYSAPSYLSKTATSPKTPPVTSPPFSSKTSLDKVGSRAPGLSGQAVSPQRALSPPALPQDEPPWMALAKKKAKAWSEMPQIVQ
ncbi:uncharacterized protein FYW49_006447 [Xenentodon cancila]